MKPTDFSKTECSLDESEDDTLHEECGIFGILDHPDATTLTALGLHALQHRGQEATGIVTFDGEKFHAERRLGLVGDHYTDPKVLKPFAWQYCSWPCSLFHNRWRRLKKRTAAFC